MCNLWPTRQHRHGPGKSVLPCRVASSAGCMFVISETTFKVTGSALIAYPLGWRVLPVPTADCQEHHRDRAQCGVALAGPGMCCCCFSSSPCMRHSRHTCALWHLCGMLPHAHEMLQLLQRMCRSAAHEPPRLIAISPLIRHAVTIFPAALHPGGSKPAAVVCWTNRQHCWDPGSCCGQAVLQTQPGSLRMTLNWVREGSHSASLA